MKEHTMVKLIERLPEWAKPFVLRWAALFGLLVTTSNCPFCGQPAATCPTAAAGFGILSGIISSISGIFRRRDAHRHDPAKSPTVNIQSKMP